LLAVDIRSLSIQTIPSVPLAVQTAAVWTADWLKNLTGEQVPVIVNKQPIKEGVVILLGTLDQPEIRQIVEEFQLPEQLANDGYVIAHLGNILLVYSQQARGVVYACGYELPKKTRLNEEQLDFNIELVVEEPDDRLRAWCTWKQDCQFLANAATKYRLNMVWMDASVTSEVLLPVDTAFAPFIQPHQNNIVQLKKETEDAVALAKSFGLEIFLGGVNGFFVIPDYLYAAIVQTHPEMLASGYRGGSEWPPYEWQDRPNLCPSHPNTRQFYMNVVDEFLNAHPEADGVCLGVGYDGYPLGCGCQQCQNYAYYDRFHDQVMWVFDVAVKKHHKKLWLWTWVCGCNSVIPGYEHYFGWVKDFAEANPDSVIISSFATEADFLITHQPNPVIGSRGPNDMGMVLIWPEYRGDGVVPAWLFDWMEINLPILRSQGCSGFAGTDVISSHRELDLIQGAEMFALSEMMWDNQVTAQQAALAYCTATFGERAAGYLAPALRNSGSVIAKTLFLPSGIRFSGHSHIENDLRVMWDVYTLYDSAPSFLNQEQRQEIIKAGPPYAPKVEAALPGLSLSDENIHQILTGKDEAVEEAAWMISQIELARPHLSPTHYEELHTRSQWLLGYARLFRGLTRAVFHLRRGKPSDGNQVIAGAEEMQAAMNSLPQSGPPLPYNIQAQFGDYPWMITPPLELINTLHAAGKLLKNGIDELRIGIIASEETTSALDSLFLPYTRCSLDSDFSQFDLLVLGPSAMSELEADGAKVAAFIQSGGRVLLFNPTENWKVIPSNWLPGKVESWVCNHPKVMVTEPEHPITKGYRELKSEPISRFQATSAGVAEAARFSPFIKSFLAVSNNWKTLTYPVALVETTWGNGHVIINLIPENRTILVRALAYLNSFRK
jgi:hypothetical protein